MANPYQQRVLQRKLIYLGLILVLASAALLQRRFVVEPQAYALQLRETSRGEVELSGAAVRLLLTGSRGLAVPILWSGAIKAQERHQWTELKLLVNSVTKLQPYFISPWLFQSWNLAFNVAVEHDRPRDKYLYVSAGLALLAEGERRNQGTSDPYAVVERGKKPLPGNPEMRHNIGFFYQLKIGNSDEKNTMRCLLDLSCIDPAKRKAGDFWTSTEAFQQQVDAQKFDEFCQENPRLIRRLREQLHYDSRAQIVKFLEENRDVPSRFTHARAAQPGVTLAEPREQFPILPPALSANWPDPTKPDLNLNSLADGMGETLDVFLVSRTWYEYAQKPLPPPNPDPGVREVTFDPLEHRMPKALAVTIFRGYPARAQVFIAENLEAEGWFDDDGWAIPAWTDRRRGAKETEPPVVGRGARFHAGPAWAAGYRAYLEYGKENGIYLSPGEEAELNDKAALVRKKYDLKPEQRFTLRSDLRQGELNASYEAHQKLVWNSHYRGLNNYDAHISQAEAEKDPLTVYARKLLYQAERARRFERAPDQALVLYEELWPLWTYVCLKYPKFTQVQVLQEDVYEAEMWYVRLAQTQREQLFRKVFLGMAQMNAWPYPPWEELLESSATTRIVPIRTASGPMDAVQYYDAANEVRPLLQAVLEGASTYRGTAFVPPLLDSNRPRFLLTRSAFRAVDKLDPNSGWKWLVEQESIDSVRVRLGWDRLRQAKN